MLTLIKGKARKSVYMIKLANSTSDSLFIKYGHNNVLNSSPNNEFWAIDRSEKTETSLQELELEIMELVRHVLKTTTCKHIFLYGNFKMGEVEVLKDVVFDGDGLFSITASVQDSSVPDGQIVIEEFIL